MSTSTPSHESVSFNGESFEIATADESHTNVANQSYGSDEAKDHTYTVTLDEDGAAECTCPHYTYRSAFCKHMAAVESAIVVSTLDATDDNEKEISGPHVGRDKYGNVDHHYWECESCGAEATREEALEDCC
ncbi:SWIM zinc finger family protein [Haladaptatus sp. CMAA 1911]|uniref:SWIM zinc finger family protein n=1 Tax=unclassified Haladaptatus TaxID=2622732 RepID=UPI0037543DCE